MVIKEKIFAVGLNKTGTNSMKYAFEIKNIKCLHNPREFSISVENNIVNNNKILMGINNFDFFSDIFLPSNVKGGSEFIKSLEFKKIVINKLYDEYPNAYYIINYRDLNSWLNSRKKHIKKK